MNATFTWNETECIGVLPGEYGTVTFLHSLPDQQVPTGAIALFIKQGQLVAISDQSIENYDRVLLLQPTWEMEQAYFLRYLQNYSQEQQWLPKTEMQSVPDQFENIIAPYVKEIVLLLHWSGYNFQEQAKAPAKKGGKAAHRWSKAVSTIPFYTEYDGTKATVYWQKRNELVIKKGAIMRQETPLNKDGSVGFAAKFALTLRQEQADKYDTNFVTKEDVVLKSVNEVGHFLYFAGTNSWLQLKDSDGKTIDEWTVVK